jgi:hypothetical protein
VAFFGIALVVAIAISWIAVFALWWFVFRERGD